MEGKRVRLIRMEDPYTKLKSGDEGVIIGQDGLGDIMVDWDNGSKLKLIPEVDEYEILESKGFIKKFFEFKHNHSFIDSKLEEFEDLIKSFTNGKNLFYEWENRDDHEVIINFELDGDFYRYELDIDDLILTKVVGDEVIFSEEVIDLDEGLDIIEKDIHDIIGVTESIILESKNDPTNKKLWSECKSWAKSKYDVWPSAYAVGAAAKRYKSKGGKWVKKSKKSKKSK